MTPRSPGMYSPRSCFLLQCPFTFNFVQSSRYFPFSVSGQILTSKRLFHLVHISVIIFFYSLAEVIFNNTESGLLEVCPISHCWRIFSGLVFFTQCIGFLRISASWHFISLKLPTQTLCYVYDFLPVGFTLQRPISQFINVKSDQMKSRLLV